MNDATVQLVSNETIKKKYCFEIVTPTRTYYICGKSDEEVTDWIKSIDSAKANFKSGVINRNTSFGINNASDANVEDV